MGNELLEGTWRDRVIEAELRYRQSPNAETEAEYLRMLQIFRDFVVHGKTPKLN